jgi:hypothetical protein
VRMRILPGSRFPGITNLVQPTISGVKAFGQIAGKPNVQAWIVVQIREFALSKR